LLINVEIRWWRLSARFEQPGERWARRHGDSRRVRYDQARSLPMSVNVLVAAAVVDLAWRGCASGERPRIRRTPILSGRV
jgi:hypothetical protein